MIPRYTGPRTGILRAFTTSFALNAFDFRIAPAGRDMLLRPLTRAGRHRAAGSSAPRRTTRRKERPSPRQTASAPPWPRSCPTAWRSRTWAN